LVKTNALGLRLLCQLVDSVPLTDHLSVLGGEIDEDITGLGGIESIVEDAPRKMAGDVTERTRLRSPKRTPPSR
jgi:hypothetical protein